MDDEILSITGRPVVVVFILSAVLVFLVKDPAWRVVGLVLAVVALLIDVAVTKRVAHAG